MIALRPRRATSKNGATHQRLTLWKTRITKSNMKDTTISMRAGTRLKAARLALGFASAKAFAAALDVRGQTYRRYERGEIEAPFTVLLRLYSRFGISPNDLLLPEVDERRSRQKIERRASV